MTRSTQLHPLDAEVRRLQAALKDRGCPAPGALLWLATGTGQVPDALARGVEVDLGELDAPGPWSGCTLFAGHLFELPVWVLEDHSGEPLPRERAPGWIAGLPAWLAARAGAAAVLHTTAGSALPSDAGPRAPVGGIGLVRDHLNLSGSSPLLGLGESRLGPLFPDLTELHHIGLRRRAQARAEALGWEAAEVVAVCTASPALETPAERAYFARAGGDVAVQGLQVPLLAAAHAGLALLSLVAVADSGEGPADVAALVEAAGVQERMLEDLIQSLAPDLAEAVQALTEDA